MSLKLNDEIDSTTIDNLVQEDGNVVYELSCSASNIKKEVVQVFWYFSFLLKKIWTKKGP